jgi:hypothetical protein
LERAITNAPLDHIFFHEKDLFLVNQKEVLIYSQEVLKTINLDQRNGEMTTCAAANDKYLVLCFESKVITHHFATKKVTKFDLRKLKLNRLSNNITSRIHQDVFLLFSNEFRLKIDLKNLKVKKIATPSSFKNKRVLLQQSGGSPILYDSYRIYKLNKGKLVSSYKSGCKITDLNEWQGNIVVICQSKVVFLDKFYKMFRMIPINNETKYLGSNFSDEFHWYLFSKGRLHFFDLKNNFKKLTQLESKDIQKISVSSDGVAILWDQMNAEIVRLVP